MKKNNYMGVWTFCMILMLFAGVFSYVRETYSDFNGLTGNLGVFVKVSYSSNYPDKLNMNNMVSIHSDLIGSTYFIEKNMFEVPSGYVFYSWNTKEDGSGILYTEGKFHKLEANMNLYAIWGMNILGDINLDGVVNEEDTLLLNKYLNDTSYLMGVVSLNADVNLDGKIDLVDVDIIKQALLGTSGYNSLLSNEPVFIYEIYKPSNNNSNNNNNNNGNNNSNGGTGNNGGGTSSNGGGTAGNNNSGNNASTNTDGSNNKQDDIDNDIDKENDNEIDNNSNNNLVDNKKSKSYLWLFVIGICFVSLRIGIDIIKKTVNKNKE